MNQPVDQEGPVDTLTPQYERLHDKEVSVNALSIDGTRRQVPEHSTRPRLASRLRPVANVVRSKFEARFQDTPDRISFLLFAAVTAGLVIYAINSFAHTWSRAVSNPVLRQSVLPVEEFSVGVRICGSRDYNMSTLMFYDTKVPGMHSGWITNMDPTLRSLPGTEVWNIIVAGNFTGTVPAVPNPTNPMGLPPQSFKNENQYRYDFSDVNPADSFPKCVFANLNRFLVQRSSFPNQRMTLLVLLTAPSHNRVRYEQIVEDLDTFLVAMFDSPTGKALAVADGDKRTFYQLQSTLSYVSEEVAFGTASSLIYSERRSESAITHTLESTFEQSVSNLYSLNVKQDLARERLRLAGGVIADDAIVRIASLTIVPRLYVANVFEEVVTYGFGDFMADVGGIFGIVGTAFALAFPTMLIERRQSRFLACCRGRTSNTDVASDAWKARDWPTDFHRETIGGAPQ